MKNKARLAFELLERKMEIVDREELRRINGGAGPGEVTQLLTDYFGQPVTLLNDPDGNWMVSINGGTPRRLVFQLEDVEITSGGTVMSNGTTLYYDWNEWTNTGLYWTGTGYSPQDPNSNLGGGGGYQLPNPWKRDSDGNIILTPVEGKTTSIDYGGEGNGFKLTFQEVKINTRDNLEITAYKVVSVYDKTNATMLTNIPDQFKSNCTGFAFMEGKVWLYDPFDGALRDPDFNEMENFDTILTNSNYFLQSDKEFGNLAAIWWTDTSTGERFIAHSAQMNADGTYTQKNDYGSVQQNISENEFTAGHIPSGAYTYEIKYYKKNF